jgi:hypothetical protein
VNVSSNGTVKAARVGASPSNRGNWAELDVVECRLEILFRREGVAIFGEIGSSIAWEDQNQLLYSFTEINNRDRDVDYRSRIER